MSTGVNDTVTVAVGHARRPWAISGVCRWTPPMLYAAGRPDHLGAEQVGLGGAPGAGGAADRDHGDRRARPGPRRRREAAPAVPRSDSNRGRRSGWRRAGGPGHRAVRAGRRARCRRAASRRTRSQAVGVGEPEVGTAVDDHGVGVRVARPAPPSGRAAARGTPRRGRRAPRASVVSEHPRRQRQQVRVMLGERACPRSSAAVSAPMVSRPSAYAGWPSSSRRISPPAYPLAPATATEVMQTILHCYAVSCK